MTRATITVDHVDLDLLRRQQVALAEVQAWLTTGEPQPAAERWPEAIEGILNLLAAVRVKED